ncbi:MAG: RagB/SusD family nutrient uptake outer membrane protein, partial [Winogradskyella sp.]|uniref:RagB/SusD family nutrient uptake outer membrane protein n=1 Tax=Winogradskyella sp. TaxID=1883156 RepID=UPI0025E30271
MNNYLLKYAVALLMIMTFFTCSEDINYEITENSVDLELASQLIDDLYAKMYTPGSGGTQSHADFGHKTYDLFSDILIGDMALSNSIYGWYPEQNDEGTIANVVAHLCTTDYTHESNYQVWTHYYDTIEIANTIIGFMGGDDANPETEEERHFLGQALAMRAHSYFYLAQYMANEYDPEAEILPIYREANSDYMPKSTTVEVFQLIESDLNRAIDLLENYQRPSKKYINKFMAQAILAYAIAAQKNVSRLAEVIALCDEVITSSGATIMNYTEVTGGFNNVNTSGWIWGVDITSEMNLRLVSWWGHVDAFSYSYAWAGDSKAIDQNLYNTILTSDVRKAQFYIGSGYYNLMPLYKFYDADRIIGGPAGNVVSDYVYMRITELHLLKAESLAKLGQDAEARVALAEVLSERLPDLNYLNSLSGEELEDEIYLQTRI